MTTESAFLGTGWSFPPTFDGGVGEVRMTSGVEDIERSLEIIFSTALGERLMNPTFGCAIDTMLFEPMNASVEASVRNLLETAILYYEPRIDADTIEVSADDLAGVLKIAIEYTVRTTNSRFNFVYDFYLNEASG